MNTATFLNLSARKFMLVALLFLGSFTIKAQTPYNVSQIAYAPYPFTGTAVPIGDDAFSGVIPIGFTFNFFGANQTDLIISSNGIVSFDVSNANGYSAWPINSSITGLTPSSHNSVLVTYHDLNIATGGQILYSSYGVSPNRVFVVSYYNVPMFSCSNITFTAQVALHETSNNIDVFIQNKQTCSWNGGYSIQGILGPGGTEAYVVPDRDYPEIWTASGDAWRFEYCSANYTDTIKGRVYVDLNHNCIFDGNDYGLYNRKVSSNNACADAYTDADGFYLLKTEQGTCNVTHTYPQGVLPACPANNINVVTFPGPNMMQDNVDFADTTVYDCSDVNLQVATPLVRPCSTSIYTFTYSNPTPNPTGPMTLTVTIPDSFYYVSSSIPFSSVNGNIYTFPLPAMGPYSSATFTMADSVSCDVTVGTNKVVHGVIDNPGDCDTSDNDDIEIKTVVNSYDPNNVIVASDHLHFVYGEQISNADTLTYQINFQNTGSAEAIHVIVKDTLDMTVDHSTIELLNASHYYQFSNDNGRLTFAFTNIHLPDSNSNEPASHGFVRFKIRQTPGNGMGTLIPNQAHIYFDNNPPVLTNIATDTIATLNVKQYVKNNEFTIYPNPARDMVTLSLKNATGRETVQVYDMVGNLVYSASVSNKHQVIATGTWAKGVYMIRVNENGVTVAGKLLVVE